MDYRSGPLHELVECVSISEITANEFIFPAQVAQSLWIANQQSMPDTGVL
jgi:hypothetical protein